MIPEGPPPDPGILLRPELPVEPAAGPRLPDRRSPFLRSDFANKVAQTLGTQLVLGVLGLATGIATARWLGPTGKGHFALVTIVVTLVFSLTQFGISQSVVYFTKRVPAPELLSNALSLSAVMGIVALVVGGAIAYFGAAPLLDLERPLLLLALLALPFLFMDGTGKAVVQGSYEVTRYNVLRVVNPAIFLPLFVGALLLDDRLKGTVLAWLVAGVVSSAAAVTVAVRGSGVRARDLAPSWARWQELVHFGLRAHLGNVLKFFQYRFDVVLIGALLDKRQVGLYVVGVSLAELPLHIPDAVGLVLFPKVAAVTAESKREETTPLVSRHTIFLTVTLSAVLFVLAPTIITLLLGSRFERAHIPARLLLVGGVTLSLWKILAQDLIGRGRPAAFSFSAFCSLVTMVVGCTVLIPWLGLAGGAIASSIAYTVAAVTLFITYHRETGVRLRDCVLMRRSDFALYGNALRRLFSR